MQPDINFRRSALNCINDPSISTSGYFQKTTAIFDLTPQKSLEIKICLPLAEQNRNQASDEIFRISAGVTNICLFVKVFERIQ